MNTSVSVMIDLLSAASMWRGVIVNPLDKAYEKPEEKEQAAEDMDLTVIDHVKTSTA